MAKKKQELIFLANDDDEVSFSFLTEQIQNKLGELHNCVAKLAPMVERVGTMEDSPKFRSKITRTKDSGFALAKSIHASIIELDNANCMDTPSSNVTVKKPKEVKKKLEADYKRLLKKLEQVINSLQIKLQAHPQAINQEQDVNNMESSIILDEPQQQQQKAKKRKDDDNDAYKSINDPKLKFIPQEQVKLMASQEESKHLAEIEQDANDLAEIAETSNVTIQAQNKQIEQVKDNVDNASVKVEQGKGELKKAAALAAVGTALIGATLGAVVLGPVGGLVGAYVASTLSVGAAAGVGAGVVAGGTVGAGAAYAISKKAAKKAAELPKDSDSKSSSEKQKK